MYGSACLLNTASHFSLKQKETKREKTNTDNLGQFYLMLWSIFLK